MGGRAPGPSGMADLRSTTLMMEYSNTHSNERYNQDYTEPPYLDFLPNGFYNPNPSHPHQYKRRLYRDGIFHDTHDGRGELLYYPRGYNPNQKHHPPNEQRQLNGLGMPSVNCRCQPCGPSGAFGGGFGTLGFGGVHGVSPGCGSHSGGPDCYDGGPGGFGGGPGGYGGGPGGYGRGHEGYDGRSRSFSEGPGGYGPNGQRRGSVAYPAYVSTKDYEPGDEKDPGHPKHTILKDKRSGIEGEEEFTEGEKVGIFDMPGRHDTAMDWVGAMSCFCIIAGLIGILHTYGVFILTISLAYNISLFHTVICGAATYSLVIWFGPISAMMVKAWGNRWPAIIGLFLFAFGLVLDAFQLDSAVLLLVHFLFMGVGGSMAYTAAVTQNSDHFRKNLVASMIMIGVSSALGTAFIYFIGQYLLYNIGYFWTIITQAIGVIILMFIALLLSNRTEFDPDLNAEDKYGNYKAYNKMSKKTRKQKIRECIAKTVDDSDPNLVNFRGKHDREKSVLCVCMYDCSMMGDLSFLLWACISMLIMVTVLIPYFFLIYYVQDAEIDDSVFFVIIFCVVSAIVRGFGTLIGDYSFNFTRIAFVIVCILIGILWIILHIVETYGWMFVWTVVLGALEGFLVVLIPRVTIGTIPKRWLTSSWVYIILFHGFGIFMGPVIVIVLKDCFLSWTPGFITIGVIAIMAGILAILLPDEELEEKLQEEELEREMMKDGNEMGRFDGNDIYEYGYHPGGNERFNYGRRGSGLGGQPYRMGNHGRTGHGFDGDGSNGGGFSGDGQGTHGRFERVTFGREFRSSFGLNSLRFTNLSLGTLEALRTASCCTTSNTGSYARGCPICRKAGCALCCPSCVPGGLVTEFSPSCKETQNNENKPNCPTNSKSTSTFNPTKSNHSFLPVQTANSPSPSGGSKNIPSTTKVRNSRSSNGLKQQEGKVKRVNLEIRHNVKTTKS